MRIVKVICCFILLLFNIGCDNDIGLGVSYQKILITQKADTQIYCYRLNWGLNGEAWYLSSNKEVCMGFDSTKDVCFGQGIHHIYYDTKNDTLSLYSNYIPPLPNKFPINIKAIRLNLLEANEYEDSFTKGKIRKIEFDTIVYKTPCDAVPFSPVNNMKFKPRQ